jgi:gas vesicle protein
MSKINKEIYDMVYEEDFAEFNRLFNVMCHYGDKCYNTYCTYAHNADQLKVPICLYHFSDGCSNTVKTCKFSHTRSDAIKALKNYKTWLQCDEEDATEIKAVKDENELTVNKFHEMVSQADKEIDDAISEVSDDLDEEYALSLIGDEWLLSEMDNLTVQSKYMPLSEELAIIEEIMEMHEEEESEQPAYQPPSMVDQLALLVCQQNLLIQNLYSMILPTY